MNAAVIGASSESIYAISKAKEAGLFVTALDGNPEAPGLQAADASFVVDIRDTQAVFSILDRQRPDVILPVPIGRYLTTTGAANDRYGLKGVSLRSASLCTDKYEFHTLLHAHGLRNASLALLRAGDTQLPSPLPPCPVVLKPRFGSGSRGVEIFEDEAALRHALQQSLPLPEDYVIESCIPGREYGVDGVFQNGRFTRILLREKRITPPPYRQCVGYYALPAEGMSDADAAFAEKTDALLQQCGSALGFCDNLLHADIIRDAGDAPFLIEISARPSGHNLHNLFTPMASGVDEVGEFIRYALGQPHSFAPRSCKPMMIGYFDMEHCRILSVPKEEELRSRYPLRAWDCRLAPGMECGSVTDGASLMGRGFYILETDTPSSPEETHLRLMSEFRLENL